MRLNRCYVDQPLHCGQELTLDERAHRHLVQVLRLRVGTPLVLFNGQGGEYEARLIDVQRRASRVAIDAFVDRDTRPQWRIQLAQGLAKGERMDFILQKATELGVSEIQPVIAQRSVGPDDAKRLAKRLQHWQGVIISACEQCGRNDLPLLHPVVALSAWIHQMSQTSAAEQGCFYLDPGASQSLASANCPASGAHLLIGPEGGLDPREITQAQTAGFRGLTLGPRILRTETAGLAALAILQSRCGDMG